MKRRALTIGLAVLLAILGTAGVLAYVNHANDRALAGQRAVTVLVATSLIPAGTSATQAQDQGLLTTEKLPADSVPGDALTSVTPEIGPLVTDAEVERGQVLTSLMLVTSAQATNGLAVPKHMFAVALQFCVPEAVAGNVYPGAEVAVFQTTVKFSSSTSNNASTGSASGLTAQAACSGSHQLTAGLTVHTTLVLNNVEVLSVGQGTGSTSTGSTTTSNTSVNVDLITLAVSAQDAETLISLAHDGLPYLALVAAS